MAESIMEMYARLNSEGAELEAGVVEFAKSEVSALHTMTLDVLKDMIGMATKSANNAAEVPTQVRMMVAMLGQLTPMLEERLAKVPPEAIRDMLRQARDKIEQILAVSTEEIPSVSTAEQGAGAATPATADTRSNLTPGI